MGSARSISRVGSESAGPASIAFWIADRVNRARHQRHTEAKKSQKNQSILLMERSSRSVALPPLSGARVSLRGGGFPIIFPLYRLWMFFGFPSIHFFQY